MLQKKSGSPHQSHTPILLRWFSLFLLPLGLVSSLAGAGVGARGNGCFFSCPDSGCRIEKRGDYYYWHAEQFWFRGYPIRRAARVLPQGQGLVGRWYK